MNKQPKISIVVITHNRLTLLKRAVSSAISQSVACEIVVVDDFSEDGTREYCGSLKSRIIYHRNETCLCQSASRNIGISLASGDWIKLLDDDDFLDSKCIEEILKAISLHAGTVICSCQTNIVNEDGDKKGTSSKIGSGEIIYVPQEDIHYGMLLEFMPIGTPSQVAFRKDIFLKTDKYDTSLTKDNIYGEDVNVSLDIARFGDLVIINKPLVSYTVWSQSGSRNMDYKTRLERNYVLKEKMYALVSDVHRRNLPPLKCIKRYLKLYWGIMAIRDRKLISGLQILFPAIFSIVAWTIFLSAIISRKNGFQNKNIRHIILQR